MNLKAFLLGAASAATITLLTTKRSGKENQALLKDFANQFSTNCQKTKQAYADTKFQLEYVKELAQDSLPTFINDLQTDIEDFKFQISPRLNQLQQSIDNLKKDLNLPPK